MLVNVWHHVSIIVCILESWRQSLGVTLSAPIALNFEGLDFVNNGGLYGKCKVTTNSADMLLRK